MPYGQQLSLLSKLEYMSTMFKKANTVEEQLDFAWQIYTIINPVSKEEIDANNIIKQLYDNAQNFIKIILDVPTMEQAKTLMNKRAITKQYTDDLLPRSNEVIGLQAITQQAQMPEYDQVLYIEESVDPKKYLKKNSIVVQSDQNKFNIYLGAIEKKYSLSSSPNTKNLTALIKLRNNKDNSEDAHIIATTQDQKTINQAKSACQTKIAGMLHQWQKLSKSALAAQDGDIMLVTQQERALDKQNETKFFKHKERAEYRVILSGGKFYQPIIHQALTELTDAELLKKYSTTNMSAHNKLKYGAYVLNTNGELLVFNHHNMRDQIAHSSMSDGTPVFGAGSICIEDGELKAIDLHSGHYRPQLKDAARILEYFAAHGVDIKNVIVVNPWHYIDHYSQVLFISTDINIEEAIQPPAGTIIVQRRGDDYMICCDQKWLTISKKYWDTLYKIYTNQPADSNEPADEAKLFRSQKILVSTNIKLIESLLMRLGKSTGMEEQQLTAPELMKIYDAEQVATANYIEKISQSSDKNNERAICQKQ